MDIQPITLIGRVVRLEPLGPEHVSDLTVAGRDPAIWRYLPYGSPSTEAEMLAYIEAAQALEQKGLHFPFAVIHQPTGRAVGSTRFLAIEHRDRGIEIGGTWYAPEVQRTAVNTESKYLLLRHAFEVLGCVRVQLKTDARNERSQRAIERIGGVHEGVLRRHMILPEGFVRDTVFYSIIDREWPAVRERLAERLGYHLG